MKEYQETDIKNKKYTINEKSNNHQVLATVSQESFKWMVNGRFLLLPSLEGCILQLWNRKKTGVTFDSSNNLEKLAMVLFIRCL